MCAACLRELTVGSCVRVVAANVCAPRKKTDKHERGCDALGKLGKEKRDQQVREHTCVFFFWGGVRSLWCTSIIANREAQTEKGIKRLGSAGATRKLEGRIGDRTDSEFCARYVWVGSSYLQTPFSQRGPSPRPTAQNPRRFLPAFLFVDLGSCRSGRKRKCDWRHEFGGAVRSLVRVRYNTPHFFFRERSTTTHFVLLLHSPLSGKNHRRTRHACRGTIFNYRTGRQEILYALHNGTNDETTLQR